jgi:hypothetical protein
MKFIQTFLILISMMFIFVSSQDQCSAILNPKLYSDCSPYSSKESGTVCCFVKGVYGANNGTACLSVDLMFSGKTVPFSLYGFTSNLICGDQVASAKYIQISFTLIISLLSLIFI